jgi:YfiH family protein
VFFWRDDDELTRAFTSRSGGVSAQPYAALNLGAHVGDEPAAVHRNRELLATALDVAPERLAFMEQCHGAEVAVVDAVGAPPPHVDALVTALPDVALVSMVADCVPVLLADRVAGVVGAVHAGRPGMLAGVVPAALAAMRDLGAREISAVVGPSVCGRCYEVPENMRAQAAAVRPESAAVSWTGTPAIDVAAGVVAQLHEERVPLEWIAGCAREDESLFSHRRDGVTGRFAGAVVRRGAGARS